MIIWSVPEGIEPSTSRLTVARSATELRNHFEHSLDEVELETTVSILQHGTSCMTLPRQNVPAVYLVSYYNYKTLWQHPGKSATKISFMRIKYRTRANDLAQKLWNWVLTTISLQKRDLFWPGQNLKLGIGFTCIRMRPKKCKLFVCSSSQGNYFFFYVFFQLITQRVPLISIHTNKRIT